MTVRIDVRCPHGQKTKERVTSAHAAGSGRVAIEIERKRDGVLLPPYQRTHITATGKEWTVLR